jgi:hypothetical protein
MQPDRLCNDFRPSVTNWVTETTTETKGDLSPYQVEPAGLPSGLAGGRAAQVCPAMAYSIAAGFISLRPPPVAAVRPRSW